VSKHMKILEDAGLLEKKRQGTWMIYRLADGSESVFAKKMLTELSDWLDDDSELDRMRKVLPAAAALRYCAPKN
ncbi:transcriptional regulator, partial [Rhodopseudomonas palustris]|nr:transcriptional regulator [Rhodopseudomonas palustris]